MPGVPPPSGGYSATAMESSGLDPDVAQRPVFCGARLPVAFHVRRGDFLHPHFDARRLALQQSHYVEAIGFLIESELGTSDFNVAVFSDDLEFVEAHLSDYGLDRVTGAVRFIRGNSHFKSIFDSYLMSLCPVIVGSVGSFAATTSLLADHPASSSAPGQRVHVATVSKGRVPPPGQRGARA